MARRGAPNEDLSNVEFETSEDVEVVPTFNSMVSNINSSEKMQVSASIICTLNFNNINFSTSRASERSYFALFTLTVSCVHTTISLLQTSIYIYKRRMFSIWPLV